MKYIIGDLHGNAAALKRLLTVISPSRQDELIFLGDYLDKNTATAETLELLHELRGRHNCRFIKGNHDYVWERFILHGEDARADFLVSYGGLETLREFTAEPEKVIRGKQREAIAKWLSPFFSLLPHMVDYCLLDSYLALHAGLTREQMNQEPLQFSEKNYFLRPRDMDFDKKYLGAYTLVAGHTYFGPEPEIHNGYIGIDLGAGYGQFLGALCVETRQAVRSDGAVFPVAQNK